MPRLSILLTLLSLSLLPRTLAAATCKLDAGIASGPSPSIVCAGESVTVGLTVEGEVHTTHEECRATTEQWYWTVKSVTKDGEAFDASGVSLSCTECREPRATLKFPMGGRYRVVFGVTGKLTSECGDCTGEDEVGVELTVVELRMTQGNLDVLQQKTDDAHIAEIKALSIPAGYQIEWSVDGPQIYAMSADPASDGMSSLKLWLDPQAHDWGIWKDDAVLLVTAQLRDKPHCLRKLSLRAIKFARTAGGISPEKVTAPGSAHVVITLDNVNDQRDRAAYWKVNGNARAGVAIVGATGQQFTIGKDEGFMRAGAAITYAYQNGYEDSGIASETTLSGTFTFHGDLKYSSVYDEWGFNLTSASWTALAAVRAAFDGSDIDLTPPSLGAQYNGDRGSLSVGLSASWSTSGPSASLGSNVSTSLANARKPYRDSEEVTGAKSVEISGPKHPPKTTYRTTKDFFIQAGYLVEQSDDDDHFIQAASYLEAECSAWSLAFRPEM